MRQDFRDRSGKLVGYRETSGDISEMRTPTGGLLGRYNSRQNETRNPTGGLIGRGDFLSSLI